MRSMDDLRNGLSRAWDSVTEGWREFVERAGDALTRFRPTRSADGVETPGDRLIRAGSRWGVVAADVVLGNDEIEVNIEIPGMEADDFDIQIVDDVLVVRGEKKVQAEHTQGELHIMERAYGRFERALRLPAAVEDTGAAARYKRGVLSISIPLSSPDSGKRRIEVSRG